MSDPPPNLSMQADKQLRVVVLDDHITPYRIPLFARLAQDPSLDVIHLFTRKRLPDRQWVIPPALNFRHQFLPGLRIPLPNPAYPDEQRHMIINPTLLWTLIRHRPDIVVGYAFSVPTWTAFLYSRLAGKHFISWSTDTPLTDRQLNRTQQAIRRYIIPRAAGCITPSTWGRSMFESYGAQSDRITVVTQAADLDTFLPEQSHGAVRTRLDLPQSAKVMVYVGYLLKRKGVQFLLEAMPAICEVVPDAHLLMIGEGKLRHTLESTIQKQGLNEHVHFLGYIQQQDLPAMYQSADVFVFPTLNDRFGVVVAEAAASGLPLVTSKFAAASFEFVRENENGFIIDPRDPQQLAQAVIQVLSDDDRRQHMARTSRQIAEEKNLDAAASHFAQALHRSAH